MTPLALIPPAIVAADITGDQYVDGADLAQALAQDGRVIANVLANWGAGWAVNDAGDGQQWFTKNGEWVASPFDGFKRLRDETGSLDQRDQ